MCNRPVCMMLCDKLNKLWIGNYLIENEIISYTFY